MPEIRPYFSVDVYTAGDMLYAKIVVPTMQDKRQKIIYVQVFTVQFGDSAKLESSCT